MNDDKRAARAAAIEQAAYELLSEKGYTGTSMLSIAKRAKCSNETLYNWYGDKLALFRTMIERNAAEARDVIESALAQERPDLSALDRLGPILLGVVLSDRAVALNRAAAADPTGELGAALAQAGRESIGALLGTLIARLFADIDRPAMSRAEAVDLYLSLLIGDLQIRRVVARLPLPKEDQIAVRARRALRDWRRLTGL